MMSRASGKSLHGGFAGLWLSLCGAMLEKHALRILCAHILVSEDVVRDNPNSGRVQGTGCQTVAAFSSFRVVLLLYPSHVCRLRFATYVSTTAMPALFIGLQRISFVRLQYRQVH